MTATKEQVAIARETIAGLTAKRLGMDTAINVERCFRGNIWEAIRVLLLATSPIGSPDPRSADMAELARLTAIELRKRGIWCVVGGTVNEHAIRISRPADCMDRRWYSMLAPDFDNLGPVGCADEIQRQEARQAQEWAADK